MANSWGESGTTWGKGDWGQQSTTTVALSGLSITGSLGTPATHFDFLKSSTFCH